MKYLLALLLTFTTTAVQAIDVSVFFPPEDDCPTIICHAINDAHEEILLQAYSFTDEFIGQAVKRAKDRGLGVIVLIDKDSINQSPGKNPDGTIKPSVAAYLEKEGVQVMAHAKHQIAHDKIILIDQKIIFTGSYNFSRNAQERNAENLVMITPDKELREKDTKFTTLMDRYRDNFFKHYGHGEWYKPPKLPPPLPKAVPPAGYTIPEKAPPKLPAKGKSK